MPQLSSVDHTLDRQGNSFSSLQLTGKHWIYVAFPFVVIVPSSLTQHGGKGRKAQTQIQVAEDSTDSKWALHHGIKVGCEHNTGGEQEVLQKDQTRQDASSPWRASPGTVQDAGLQSFQSKRTGEAEDAKQHPLNGFARAQVELEQ